MKIEYSNFIDALAHRTSTKHHYKVVESGVGKANAASTVALEVYGSDIDLCVVIGYAAAGKGHKLGDVVMPCKACYHDTKIQHGIAEELTKVYDLHGSDECFVLTGDRFVDKPLADKLTSEFGDKAVFDMEITAISQICDDVSLPVLAVKMISDIPQFEQDEQHFIKFVEENCNFYAFLAYLELL